MDKKNDNKDDKNVNKANELETVTEDNGNEMSTLFSPLNSWFIEKLSSDLRLLMHGGRQMSEE